MGVSIAALRTAGLTIAWVAVFVYTLAHPDFADGQFCRYLSFGLIAAAVLSAMEWRRTIRLPAQRLARGECVHCGYPGSGVPGARCPECGEKHDF